MRDLLNGKVAFLTGGSGGIGLASGRMLAGQGAKIILADLVVEKARELAEEINAAGGEARVMQFDVADFEHLAENMAKAESMFGRIDILVNIAGITGSTPIEEISFESWDKMMDIDLKSTFFITKEVFKGMKARESGKIVFVSSLAALRGGRSSDCSYAAAKAAEVNLGKSFALSGAQYNITSNVICPGNVLTPMGKTLSWSRRDPKTYIPMGHFGSCEDVAYAVLFYASRMSDYITGDVMNISGGLYM